MLSVQLNGTLIDSRRLTSPAPVTIPLPPTAQRVADNLTLTVARDRDLGGCDVRVTSYPIALTDSAALILGTDPGAGFTALTRSLADGFTIYISDADPAATVTALNAAIAPIAQFVPAQLIPAIIWGGAPPGDRAFVSVGTSPGIAVPVAITDGRIISGSPPQVDISSFDSGLIVAVGTTPRARGLVVTWAGRPIGTPLPPFGRESAQVISTHGWFPVTAAGDPIATDSATPGPTG